MTAIEPSASVASAPSPEVVTPPAAETGKVLLIQPRRGWIPIDWRELWAYRELLYFLIWRDVKVRYKQTALGVTWAVLQPVFSMLIFTVIFGGFAQIPSDDTPYAVFVYAGLLPWTFFANSVTLGGQSLVNQQHLLTKVYLPRLFVPAASVGGGLLDMLISMGVYGIILARYRIVPSWHVIFLPALILLTVMVALSFCFLLAALTVSYRDFRYVVPFMIQILLYLSPVVYPVSIIPQQYHWVLALNPMVGIIDGYRAAILGIPFHARTLEMSIVVTLLMLAFSSSYFRKTEQRFADIA